MFRIGESSPSSQGKDTTEESKSEAGSSPEPHRYTSVGATGRGPGARVGLTETQGPAGMSERPVRNVSGTRRGGENNTERYLHRILH